jgi:large subunit ribosomal protein L15
MMIHDITVKAGRYKKRLRVGRGEGGGRGKQSGRGNKGAGSRSGTTRRAAFEGGQMPLFRRIRKYGFSNAKFRTEFWTVNLGQIVAADAFKNGGVVNTDTLIKAGLLRDASRPLKILGGLDKGSKISAKLSVTANRVSESVRRIVTEAGGSVSETGTRKDMTRGVDRNTTEREATNLTKKAKRRTEAAKKEADMAAKSTALGAAKAEKSGAKAAPKGDAAPKGEKADKPAKPAKADKADKGGDKPKA